MVSLNHSFVLEHDKEHLKKHEYVYKKMLEKKPDTLKLVVNDEQDLIIQFEDFEGNFVCFSQQKILI